MFYFKIKKMKMKKNKIKSNKNYNFSQAKNDLRKNSAHKSPNFCPNCYNLIEIKKKS
jgi:hypothetical protein